MRRLLAALIALTTSCTPPANQEADDPEARAVLMKRADEVSRLRKRLDTAEPKVLEACEFQAGDCLMHLRDKRRDLIRGRTFLECDALKDEDEKARCEEGKLLERGEVKPVEQYYDYNIWCLGGMEDCIARLEDQAVADQHSALVAKRRKKFFASEPAMELTRRLAVADDQLAFVRTTLPPTADGICQGLTNLDDCNAEATKAITDLEQFLVLPDAEYDEARAQELLKAAKTQEVKCVQLEQECITAKLDQYGADDTTRALMKENFELLQQRRRLQDRVDPATADECLREGEASRADYILANYRHYASRQVSYFRIQILRAFTQVHRVQIRCLDRAAK